MFPARARADAAAGPPEGRFYTIQGPGVSRNPGAWARRPCRRGAGGTCTAPLRLARDPRCPDSRGHEKDRLPPRAPPRSRPGPGLGPGAHRPAGRAAPARRGEPGRPGRPGPRPGGLLRERLLLVPPRRRLGALEEPPRRVGGRSRPRRAPRPRAPPAWPLPALEAGEAREDEVREGEVRRRPRPRARPRKRARQARPLIRPALLRDAHAGPREARGPVLYVRAVARLARKVPENAPGDLFVDDTCIACDTCRRLAPATFGGGEDDTAFVARQPGAGERRRALMAL